MTGRITLCKTKCLLHVVMHVCYVGSIDIMELFWISINSGALVPVLLFGDCAFAGNGLLGVLVIMGYFSTGGETV